VLVSIVALVAAALVPLHRTQAACACSQPGTWSIAGAFDLVANGQAGAETPQPLPGLKIHTVPAAILKAVGWVESNWRQFTPTGRPLVSFDFGYGIMQITSGMAGAFGSATGSIDPTVQGQIAGDYRYNIAYGAMMLEQKWSAVPKIGDGDPSEIETWYYALWAYNGWGWVNNPNNPRFSRTGTPATNPAGFPYQERVLYLVAHPPRDQDGNPLWRPIPVWLPSHSTIGTTPRSYTPRTVHRENAAPFGATFNVAPLTPIHTGGTQRIGVSVQNTGTQAWAWSGSGAVQLVYHVFAAGGDPWDPFSPFSNGVIALGQGAVPLPHNVLPGAAVTLHQAIRAPSTPGKYLIAWDLEELPSILLSQAGLLTRARVLTVVATGKQIARRTPTPSPVARPTESALFVADTGVPDATVMRPGQTFVKSWLVYNNGPAAWGSRSVLHHVGGPRFGGKTLKLPLLAACRTTTLSVTMKAPARPGSYKSLWAFRDGAGHAYGDRLTVVIDVGGPQVTGTPIPTPTPTDTPEPGTATPTDTATPVG
jgi:hypothetical protein